MSSKNKGLDSFLSRLKKGKTEEDIKGAFAKHFDIEVNTSDSHDLYTRKVLFEFKFNKNLNNILSRAQVIAQTLYYIRRLKYRKYTDKPIPAYLCGANENEAFISLVKDWAEFYTDTQKLYDWDLAPSKPDINLVNAISQTKKCQDIHVYKNFDKHELAIFSEILRNKLSEDIDANLIEKKQITEENFEDVFVYWNKIFGDSVRNGLKPSRYFVSDIQFGNTEFNKAQSKALFRVGRIGEYISKKITESDYEHFWNIYEKVKDVDLIRSILAKIDRLTDEKMRRFHGEFFTPLDFAKKALDYIEKAIGAKWWLDGNYRLWDMAAGTGNLEYYLPQDALQYCYLSTLYKEDVEHLNRLFTDATIFQYDYLNDDIGNLLAKNDGLQFELTWKLPSKLREDLNNPHLKWIILINPPFATAQKAGFSGGSKKDVSDTIVRKIMHSDDLGEVSRELFSQFIYRIKHEFDGKDAHLMLFSTLKYLNANNDQKMRDKQFKFRFENGFVFSSSNFDGTKKGNDFPVSCILWYLNSSVNLENQRVVLDVFNESVEKIGVKEIISSNRSEFLSKWIKRPEAKIKYPPFGSAIEVKADNKDRRDRVAQNFLASFMCKGNDFQNQNYTAFLSGPYVSAGALSVTPDNFEKAMVVHTARRLPKATWLNDRDQFLKPSGTISNEFIIDCAVWSLFSNSNSTVAMKDVVYEGITYQIHNHFFPFLIKNLKKLNIPDTDLLLSMSSSEDRFVAKWIEKKILSQEASQLWEDANKIYELYFESLNSLRTEKFKIRTWDAGWWQIRCALKDANKYLKEMKTVKSSHDALGRKLLICLKDYKIIV